MGWHVVGRILTLRFTPDFGGNSVLQFSKNSATREGEDTNHREN